MERAERHIYDLSVEIAAYLDRKPYSIVRDVDEETGDKLAHLCIGECIPPHWSAVIGDAIHNLRAAFDLVACQIVRIGTGNVTQAQFPVNMRADKFDSSGLVKIYGASQAAIEIVEGLQPYHGGNNILLWNIHKLDILDKHRMIIPVGAAHRSIGINPMTTMLEGLVSQGVILNAPAGINPIFLRPADRQFPLQDGAILFRSPAGADDSQIGKDVEFIFEIAFGEGQLVDGEPVIATLNQFVQFTRDSIELFVKEIFP